MDTYECENRRMERIIEERDDEIDRLREENERMKRSLENAVTDAELDEEIRQLNDSIRNTRCASASKLTVLIDGKELPAPEGCPDFDLHRGQLRFRTGPRYFKEFEKLHGIEKRHAAYVARC